MPSPCNLEIQCRDEGTWATRRPGAGAVQGDIREHWVRPLRISCHHRGLVEEVLRTGKMHVDEIDIDVRLVAGLFAAQFPEWADLALEPVRSAGTVMPCRRFRRDHA